MKLTQTGSSFGRFVVSPITVIALLALVTTAVAFAAPPTAINAPADELSAIVVPDEEAQSPDAGDLDGPKASHSPGACNALNGNAPQVIAELVANWPTKHDKGDATKDVPAGLQKVADRLLACQSPAAEPGASSDPNATDDKRTKSNAGKKTGQGKDH